MLHKLTIALEDSTYQELYALAGQHKLSMSHFVERVLRSHVLNDESNDSNTYTTLAASYQAMANDLEREQEAEEWAEAMIAA
jgi:hypothetical protein